MTVESADFMHLLWETQRTLKNLQSSSELGHYPLAETISLEKVSEKHCGP